MNHRSTQWRAIESIASYFNLDPESKAKMTSRTLSSRTAQPLVSQLSTKLLRLIEPGLTLSLISVSVESHRYNLFSPIVRADQKNGEDIDYLEPIRRGSPAVSSRDQSLRRIRLGSSPGPSASRQPDRDWMPSGYCSFHEKMLGGCQEAMEGARAVSAVFGRDVLVSQAIDGGRVQLLI